MHNPYKNEYIQNQKYFKSFSAMSVIFVLFNMCMILLNYVISISLSYSQYVAMTQIINSSVTIVFIASIWAILSFRITNYLYVSLKICNYVEKIFTIMSLLHAMLIFTMFFCRISNVQNYVYICLVTCSGVILIIQIVIFGFFSFILNKPVFKKLY